MRTIPLHLKEGIDRYVEQRIPTGGFLEAVLSNNLHEALACADSISRDYLYEIVMYCRWEIPSLCWGSPERVRDWLQGEGRSV